MTGSAAVALVMLVALLIGRPALASASGWSMSLAGGSAGQSAAGALSAPTGVTGTCGTGPTKSSVIVGWSAVSRAGSYTILQSTTSATSGFTTAATGLTTTSWTSPALTNGNSYWFKVVAVAAAWSSPESAATAQRTISSNACS